MEYPLCALKTLSSTSCSSDDKSHGNLFITVQLVHLYKFDGHLCDIHRSNATNIPKKVATWQVYFSMLYITTIYNKQREVFTQPVLISQQEYDTCSL